MVCAGGGPERRRRRTSLLPADRQPLKFAAEAREFTGEVEDFGPLEKERKKAIKKGLKVMCRETRMAVAAAQLAIADAGFAETADGPRNRPASCWAATTCSRCPKITKPA